MATVDGLEPTAAAHLSMVAALAAREFDSPQRAIEAILAALVDTLGLRSVFVARRASADAPTTILTADNVPGGCAVRAGAALPWQVAICERVLAAAAPVVVSDTRKDLASAAEWAAGGAGSYVGVPLRAPGGGSYGVLCAVDPEPRALSRQDADFVAATSGLLTARLGRDELLALRRAREARRESEARQAAIVEAALDCIITIDTEGKVLEFNPAAERTFGYRRAEALGRPLAELIIPPAFREQHNRGLAHYLATGEGPLLNKRVDITAVRADGQTLPVELTITPSRVNGRAAFTGYLRDITARKAAESALLASQNRLRAQNQALVDLARGKILERGDLKLALQEITEAAARTMAVARTSIWLYDDARSRLLLLDLFDQRDGSHAEGLELATAMFPAYFAALDEELTIAADDARTDPRTCEFATSYLEPLGITSMLDAPIRRGSGMVGVLGHEHVGPARTWTLDEQTFAGGLAHLVALALEAAAREQRETILRESEEALRQSEQRYRSVLDAMEEGVVVRDFNGVTLACNASAERIMGLGSEEIRGRSPPHPALHVIHEDGTLFRGEDYPSIVALRTGKPQSNIVMGIGRPDGQVIWVILNSQPIFPAGENAPRAVVTTFTDITERRRLEEHLRQAQKMEAIGLLAGGVAHDFNNLLTVINGFSELLQERMALDDGGRTYVEEIARAGQQAASLTRQLLAFSRQQVLAPEVLDLNAVVAEMEKMVRRLIGEDFDLAARLDSQLGPVRADRGQLEQVLLNLVVNARDAMPGGGKLTLETANVELDELYARAHGPVEPGSYVMLAVSDTGCGMDAATQQRIFDPFFTTKELGKGTGLGLSTVYGIVEQSGGHIWVYSEVGQGTTFKIYLPRVAEPLTEAPAPAAPFPVALSTGTVLVVEDQSDVRALVSQVLSAQGFTVLAAARGEEALRLAADHAGSIHLLLTDVVMPGFSGRDTAEQLVQARPELRVLYMSGYTDHAIVHHGVLDEGIVLLQKPFTPVALLHKVREVLEAGTT